MATRERRGLRRANRDRGNAASLHSRAAARRRSTPVMRSADAARCVLARIRIGDRVLAGRRFAAVPRRDARRQADRVRSGSTRLPSSPGPVWGTSAPGVELRALPRLFHAPRRPRLEHGGISRSAGVYAGLVGASAVPEARAARTNPLLVAAGIYLTHLAYGAGTITGWLRARDRTG